MPDPFDDMPTGDEITVPVPTCRLGQVIIAMGGEVDERGHMLRLPLAGDPVRPLPLRLGDIDLGQWLPYEIQSRPRHSGTRHMLTLRRIAKAGEE